MKPTSRLRVLNRLAWWWWLFVPAALALALTTIPLNGMRVAYSTSWSMASGLLLSVVFWPITMAAAAAAMIHAQRTGAQQVVQNLGGGAGLKDFAARWLVIGFGAISGTVTAFVVGGTLGLVNHSPLTAARLPDLLAVCVITFALVGVGLAIGLVAPWRLTPIIVALGLYLAFAFDWFGAPSLLVFGDVSTDILTYSATELSAVVWFVVFAALIGGLSFTVAWWFSAKRRLSALAITALAVLTVLVWQVISSAGFQNSVYRLTDSSEWICRDVGTHGSQVCLPPDQKRDLSLTTDHANRIERQLDQLVPSPIARDYSPGFTNTVSLSRLSLLMPLGDNSAKAFGQTASNVVSTLISACWDQDFRPTTSLDDNDVFGAAYTIGQWLNPDSTEPPPYTLGQVQPPMNPTLAEAREAYEMIETCWQ